MEAIGSERRKVNGRLKKGLRRVEVSSVRSIEFGRDENLTQKRDESIDQGQSHAEHALDYANEQLNRLRVFDQRRARNRLKSDCQTFSSIGSRSRSRRRSAGRSEQVEQGTVVGIGLIAKIKE
jgi:hypothetical protein